jgi:hypothetical protein
MGSQSSNQPSPTSSTLEPPSSPGIDVQFDIPSANSIATDVTGFFSQVDNATQTPLSPMETPIVETPLSKLAAKRPSVAERSSEDTLSSLPGEERKGPGPFLIVDDNHINVKVRPVVSLITICELC